MPLISRFMVILIVLITLNSAQANTTSNKSASFDPIEWGLSPEYNKLIIRNDSGRFVYVQISLNEGGNLRLSAQNSSCDNLYLDYDNHTRSTVCGLDPAHTITLTYESEDYSATGTYQILIPDSIH